MNFIQKLVGLTLILWLNVSFSFATNSCVSVFKESFVIKQEELIQQALKEKPSRFSEIISSQRITLKFLGTNTQGQVIIFRPNGLLWSYGFKSARPSWKSLQDVIPGASTPQGDPRYFIFLAGPSVAKLFHFEIQESSEGSILLAPNAELLKITAHSLHQRLTEKGQDGLAYLPKKADFLKIGESFQMSLSAEAPFKVFFPYEDSHPQLTFHEVSYHLGPILFPTKIHERSHQIDLAYEKVIKKIKERKLPHADLVILSLIMIRESENDSGNGNLQSTLAHFRQHFGMVSYKEIAQRIGEAHLKLLAEPLQSLTHPQMSPIEVVIRRIEDIFDIKALTNKTSPKFAYPLKPLSIPNTKLIRQAYKEFIQTELGALLHEENFDPSNRQTPISATSQLLQTFDQRLQEINDAFK